MTDNTPDKPERRSFAAAVVALFVVTLLAMFYVLSAGPVNRMVKRGYINADSEILVIYLPLSWFHDHNDTARRVLDWYDGLLE